MTVAETQAVLDAYFRDVGGQYAGRSGAERAWWVPSATGGNLRVEVTIRRRWCSVAVDRWRTTDRCERQADDWFESVVWPLVRVACKRSGRSGVLPTGGGSFASAHPIDRANLVDCVKAWVDAERLEWGLTREQMGWSERERAR